MPVGKGSILRAGSANAAVKEKEAEAADMNRKAAQEANKETAAQTEEIIQTPPLNTVTKVPLGLLKSVPRSWGEPQVDEVQVTRLAESIEAFGMILPVIAYRNKKQDLLIIKGYHRVAAAHRANLKEIPVFFLEAETDSKAKSAFAELRSFTAGPEIEKGYEVVSSITSRMPPYLL